MPIPDVFDLTLAEYREKPVLLVVIHRCSYLYSENLAMFLLFQFLEPPRAIRQHDEDAVAIQYLPDRRKPVS
jgi:hypothetical protein